MLNKETILRDEMKLHADVGEHIGYELGAKMVKDYYDKYSEAGSQFIGGNILHKILSQPNCVGIKVFNALNEKSEKTFVIIGVDNTGSPILNYAIVNPYGEIKKTEGIVADRIERDGWVDWIL